MHEEIVDAVQAGQVVGLGEMVRFTVMEAHQKADGLLGFVRVRHRMLQPAIVLYPDLLHGRNLLSGEGKFSR